MQMTEKNERSRQHAQAALDAYRAAHTRRNADSDDVAAIGDLIVDLLHLADALDPSDPQTILDRAGDDFAHESDAANSHEEV
jgi:hypothetical protein